MYQIIWDDEDQRYVMPEKHRTIKKAYKAAYFIIKNIYDVKYIAIIEYDNDPLKPENRYIEIRINYNKEERMV